MLKVSLLMRVKVYRPKKKNPADPTKLAEKDVTLIGQIRQVVFAPSGKHVVGFLVRQPDIAGMVKRPDVFVALDSVMAHDLGLVLTRVDGGTSEAAIERLGLDWDRCILWTGMDAKTTDGKELGWVDDVEFSPKTGAVNAFYVGDGSVAKSLVGNVVIPGEMLEGYANGFMLVKPEVANLALNGGLAAKAGESYARAKLSGKKAVSKAGKAAGGAVEQGAKGLGRMIGKAKKAAKNADPQKAVGKQVSRTKGMFGSFMDEYKKASK
ncbi:MAG: PRC-barrel domain containing protein [Atopobiaceae bacterium]|jgi:uncharacterized protein YrrD|nr:PRC-barrel domain containing protein [Atopobiaceae bacterium]